MSTGQAPSLHRRDHFIPHRPEIVGDGEQRRIRARANTADLDRWGTVIRPDAMRPVRGVVPLLLAHNRHVPIGTIEFIDRNAESVDFEAHVTNEEVWPLVRDGRLSGVSIGFIAHDYTEDGPTIFVDDWELVEISLVTTPANEMAQVLEVRSALMTEVFGSQPARPAAIPATRQVIPARTVIPPAVPPAELLPPSNRPLRDIPARAPAVHMRTAPHFSIGSVIAARLAGSELHGFEGEICRELQARSYGPVNGDVRIPARVFQTRALSTDAGSGSALSPEQFVQQMLDDVAAARRWGTLSPRLGYTVLSTMRESISIPKRLTVLDADWTAKDANAVESDTTFDEDKLTPKYVSTTTVLRRSAIRYADPAADTIISNDIRRALDDKVDQAVLFGAGTALVPQGLLTQQPANLVIDKAGDPIEVPDLFAIKNRMMTTWKLDDSNGGLRWCCNPALVDKLRTTSKKKIAADEGEWFSGVVPFGTDESTLLGIMLIQSGRLQPSAQGNYDLHLVMPELGVIAYFGGAAVDLLIDPYTLSQSGSVRTTAFLDVNTLARDPAIDARIANASVTEPAP